MRASAILLLVASTALGGSGLFAQTPASPFDATEPNPADFEVAAEDEPPSFAEVAYVAPKPEPPLAREFLVPDPKGPEALRYRALVDTLRERKGQFVHCRLKSGKILTGLPVNAGEMSFSLRTGIFNETLILYGDLAEAPRAVPAVGTKIKQGAEWTGIVTFVVVFFIPLALIGVIPGC